MLRDFRTTWERKNRRRRRGKKTKKPKKPSVVHRLAARLRALAQEGKASKAVPSADVKHDHARLGWQGGYWDGIWTIRSAVRWDFFFFSLDMSSSSTYEVEPNK